MWSKRIWMLLVAVLALIVVPIGSNAQGTPTASPAAGDLQLELTGLVEKPGLVTLADLQALPAQSADVTFMSGKGEQVHAYEGALLLDLINARTLVVDDATKNDKLSKYIVVTGSDGYEAVIAWGEIDPDFGNQPILVAWAEDGAGLVAARLVVPGDAHGGRYVSDIVSIDVRDIDSEPRG